MLRFVDTILILDLSAVGRAGLIRNLMGVNLVNRLYLISSPLQMLNQY